MSLTLNRPRTGDLLARHFRWLVLAAIALAGASCINKYCSGPEITCADHANDCASVPGCRVASACQAKAAPGGDGGDSACGSITDPSACNTFDPGKGFPCVWSTCSGVPDKPSCGDYPVDQCPARLNCRVMQSEPVGT